MTAKARAHAPQSVDEMLDTVDLLAQASRRVCIGDVMEAFGNRSFGPAIALPALFELSPLGAVPGIPTLLAAFIVFFAAQMAVGRNHLWIPGFVARRSLPSGKLRAAVKRLRPWGVKADRIFDRRLPALTRPPWSRVVAMGCMGLALTVPPLELIPLATSIPMAVLAVTGLALVVRDGALLLAAFAMLPIGIAVFVHLA